MIKATDSVTSNTRIGKMEMQELTHSRACHGINLAKNTVFIFIFFFYLAHQDSPAWRCYVDDMPRLLL